MTYANALINQAEYVPCSNLQDEIACKIREGDQVTGLSFNHLPHTNDNYLVSSRMIWKSGEIWILFGENGNANDFRKIMRDGVHYGVNHHFNPEDYDKAEKMIAEIQVSCQEISTQKYIKSELERYMGSNYDRLIYIS